MAGGQTPKQKQSHSRTHKRRSQHKISPRPWHACPHCNEAKLPHRVCPNCGWYNGREAVAPALAGDAE